MSSRAYVYADLSRAGLGNMLFPWARADYFAHQHGLSMLAPRWVRPKIGPLLRGERDKRYYMGLFDNSSYIAGVRRSWILATYPRLPEERRDAAGAVAGRRLIAFSGLRNFFGDLAPARDHIRQRLPEILSTHVQALLAAAPVEPYIGLHVRRGDMVISAFGQHLPDSRVPQGVPLQWFVNCLKNIRNSIGSDYPARVFSDARPGEIDDLLELPNVTHARENPAIVDIMLLARSRLLITTSNSTFSQWACFLGSMPSLWYPRARKVFTPANPYYETETDLAGNSPPEFLKIAHDVCTPIP